MHFTTVTANPCIDRTIQVDSVNLGHSHRVQKTICDFSGKGINVSLALTQLGMPVKSVCLSHSDGEAADFFKQRDMDAELIPVPGNVRINIKLFETSTGCMTEFNEKGTPLHPETAVDVIRAVKNVLPTTSVLILVCHRAFLTTSTMNLAKAHRNMTCPLFWTHRGRCF